MEWNELDNLHPANFNWLPEPGTVLLQERSFLPQREQILLVRVASQKSGMNQRRLSLPAESILFQVRNYVHFRYLSVCITR